MIGFALLLTTVSVVAQQQPVPVYAIVNFAQVQGRWLNIYDERIDFEIDARGAFVAQTEHYGTKSGQATLVPQNGSLVMQAEIVLGTATITLWQETPRVLLGTFHHWAKGTFPIRFERKQ